MGDMMTFPASVEEFMEQYKMTDTEHVYSNGTEYVPIYRMKQYFEHCRNQQRPTIDAVSAVRCCECKQGEVDDPDFRDADGTMEIFTAHTENERTEAMTPPGFAWAFYEANK